MVGVFTVMPRLPRPLGSQFPVVMASAAALMAPLLAPLIMGRVFTRDDLAALHLPFRFLYSQALKAGEFLLWTPSYHAGFFLHGAGEAGMAHPLHVALYRFLPLGPAFDLEIISSYAVAFAGTGVLLRRLQVSREAAWFGAMVFAFGSFNVFNLMHVNHIATMAHAPWLLYFAHLLLTTDDRKARAGAFVGVALTAGSQLLAGNPQYVLLTLATVGFLVLCLVRTAGHVRRTLMLAGALLLGAAIGAVQILPTLEFFRASPRVDWSPEMSLSFSLHPLNLTQLWSPFAMMFRVYGPPVEEFQVHEFIVYNGAFVTLSLAWLVMRWRQQTRRRLLVALLILAGASLLLAFGRHGGIYPLLAQLPGLQGLRAPSRFLVLFQLALSGVAAVVFEDLLGLVRSGEVIERRRLWPIAVIVVMSLVTGALAVSLADSAWAAERGIRLSGLLRAAPSTVVIITMAGLVALAARGWTRAVPLLILLTALDQGTWGYTYSLNWGPMRSIADLQAAAFVPPDARPGDRIPAVVGAQDHLALLRGLSLTTGYTGLTGRSVLSFQDRTTERLAGIAWRSDGNSWQAVPDRLPRVRLVSEALRSADMRRDLNRVDVTKVALVDQDLNLAGSPGTARLTAERPGGFEVETTADGRQLLIFTERFHEGWQAAIDGKATRPIPVYGDFLGCVVDAGDHHVSLTFMPSSVRMGFWLSLAGIAVTLLAFVVLRQSPVPAPPG